LERFDTKLKKRTEKDEFHNRKLYPYLEEILDDLAPLRSIRIRENSGQIISTRIKKWKKR